MVTVANRFDAPGCLKALTVIEADLNQLALALPEAQFHAPPRTGGWSVGHCIEHLVLTGHAFVSKWDFALKGAVANNGRGTWTSPYRWWQRRMLGLMEPPYKVRIKAKQSLVPFSRPSKEETIRRFLSMHRDFARAVDATRGLDARGTRVQSPFVSWIWYELGFSFDFALAHERRHLWQAWEVRRRLLDDLRDSPLTLRRSPTMGEF